MLAPNPTKNSTAQPGLRLAVLALLLGAEILLVSLAFDAYQAAILKGGAWFSFIARSGQFAKILVATIVFLLMGLWPRLHYYLGLLGNATVGYGYQYYLVAQLVSFALFFWLTSVIFEPGIEIGTVSGVIVVAWLAALMATGGLWLLVLAPMHYWHQLLATESKIFIFAVALGMVTWWLRLGATSLWAPLADATFQASAALLSLFYPDIVANPETKQLGAQGFVVSIAPVCSGYEGMALITMFTGFYLSIFRRDFRFPQALLLIPLGIVTIWIFNSFRIALLIAIGASVSPEIAVGGFHSQAGWISFILVSVAILMLAHHIPFFHGTRESPVVSSQPFTLPMATLIPFIALLATTILTSAVSAGFDWFYPVRVVAVAVAIRACWHFYGLTRSRVGIEAWIAGAMVFVIWVVLVPADPAANERFAAQLQSGSMTATVVWLLFRTLGAVITVPIAEELMFRGYLLSRLARQDVILEGKMEFSWIPFAASSLLFAALHDQWIAGFAAGLIYALVRYRGKGIGDAIVAHGFTNLLLTIYVLATGSWSLW